MFDRVKECFFLLLYLAQWRTQCFALKYLLLSYLQSQAYLLVSSLIKCDYMEQESCHEEPEKASSSYDSTQFLTTLE